MAWSAPPILQPRRPESVAVGCAKFCAWRGRGAANLQAWSGTKIGLVGAACRDVPGESVVMGRCDVSLAVSNVLPAGTPPPEGAAEAATEPWSIARSQVSDGLALGWALRLPSTNDQY